jgi:FAD/FMN-containing dehydrogenase
VKPYNWDIPVTPIAVTRPRTTKEVSRVVQCAAASGVKVQARSGGHSYANYCLGTFQQRSRNVLYPELIVPFEGGESGALVIDLKNFQKFEMDTDNWFATFGSGTRLGDLTDRLYNNGARTIAHGTCPSASILLVPRCICFLTISLTGRLWWYVAGRSLSFPQQALTTPIDQAIWE